MKTCPQPQNNFQNIILWHISVVPIEILLFWHHYPWPFGALGCALVGILSELVTYVSIITMISFTIER